MKTVIAGLATAVGLAVSSVAGAAVYTYQLNSVLNQLTPTSGWGSVTISDSTADTVIIDLSLTDSDGSDDRIQSLYLNLSGCSASSTFSTSPALGADFDCDKQQADGYSAGKFDVVIPDNGNWGSATSVTLTGTGLDASDFNLFDTSGKLYLAVHLGRIDSQDNSIWLGAGVGRPPGQLPEPAVLGLLGLGLAGIAAVRRRRAA